ncbi:MAG: hypothetical protein PHE83_14875 [Opitutaceae bacterium]|nr:hypothetical protein [Opitutaceae bacterium]
MASAPSPTPGLTAEQWQAKLSLIASLVTRETSLCLMGSACNLFEGMRDRTSIDLDVWLKKSTFDRPDLKHAVEAAGLLFDPKEFVEPDQPYLQLVGSDEPASAGEFDQPEELLPKEGRLEVTRPPIANLSASKMARMARKDVTDIGFLLERNPAVTDADVRKAIRTLPAALRSSAEENIVFLSLLKPTATPSPGK